MYCPSKALLPIEITAAFAMTPVSSATAEVLFDDRPARYSSFEPRNALLSSGMPLAYYKIEKLSYVAVQSQAVRIDALSLEMQKRYDALERTFKKNSEGFPSEKKNYFVDMANIMRELPFTDNVSTYNNYDESIDTWFQLPGNLSLSISQFVEDDVDAPVVFTVHRGETLLVSDEMPLEELMQTLKGIIAEEANGIEG